MRTCRTFHRTMTLLAGLLVAVPLANAQTGWPPRADGSVIGIELGHAFLDGPDDPYGGLVVSGRIRVGPRLHAVAAVPVSLGTRGTWSPESRTVSVERGASVGNLYAGLSIDFSRETNDTVVRTELGIFLPTLSDDAKFANGLFLTHLVDRMGVLWTDAVTVRASQEIIVPLGQSVGLRLHLGPDVVIATEDTGGDSAELFATYGAFLFADPGPIVINMGVDARTWLTVGESGMDVSFDDRTLQQMLMGVAWDTGTWRPYVDVRYPIGGEDDDFLSDGWILTAGLRIPIGR